MLHLNIRDYALQPALRRLLNQTLKLTKGSIASQDLVLGSFISAMMDRPPDPDDPLRWKVNEDLIIYASSLPLHERIEGLWEEVQSGRNCVLITYPHRLDFAEQLGEGLGFEQGIEVYDLPRYLALMIHWRSAFDVVTSQGEVIRLALAFNRLMEQSGEEFMLNVRTR